MMAVPMTEIAQPTIHVVAGPNGSGKTTFARRFLPASRCAHFLNADLIAAGLSPLSPAAGAIRAARLLLAEWEALAETKESFGFETTLSGKAYVARLFRAREQGYRINIYYLWVPKVGITLFRIRQRVAKGGHDVPQADAKRRFHPSLENFFRLYLPLADEALLFDASMRSPKLVAEIGKGRQTIINPVAYEQIRHAHQKG